MIQNHMAMMEVLKLLSIITTIYEPYDSHAKAMFASGERSIDNILEDHRWSAASYKHKTAWYSFAKELATCWRWRGEVPGPGKSLTDSITFMMQDSHCFSSITHRYLQLYSLQGLPWYPVPLAEQWTH